MDTDTLKVIFGVGIALLLVYEIWYRWFRKCSKCGGKVRLDEYKDSMGHNVTKTTTISFWKGPRRITEVYKCRECGDSQTRRYWTWH